MSAGNVLVLVDPGMEDLVDDAVDCPVLPCPAVFPSAATSREGQKDDPAA